jgi:hypothetical protein
MSMVIRFHERFTRAFTSFAKIAFVGNLLHPIGPLRILRKICKAEAEPPKLMIRIASLSAAFPSVSPPSSNSDNPPEASMEGVSFAGAEHSTPVPVRPPVQLSTPKPKRPVQTPKTQSATKKGNTGAKGTPGASGIKSNGGPPNRSKPGRPVKSLPVRAKVNPAVNTVPSVASVRFVDVTNKG